MKIIGSLLLALIVGLFAVWLAFQLLVGVVELVGILIGIGVAVLVFFAARKMIGKGN